MKTQSRVFRWGVQRGCSHEMPAVLEMFERLEKPANSVNSVKFERERKALQ